MSESIVLCYHAIADEGRTATRPDRLRSQVELLLRRGYRPATFADLVETDPTKAFAVTFDDAFDSVLERAFPVLESLGVPATVFVVTTFADDGRPLDWPGLSASGVSTDPGRRRSLSWDQLRELENEGWEVGSHTCTHPHLTRLDDESLARELGDSRAACSRELGRPCRSIAYPYGDLDARVLAAAAAAGYQAGCSLSLQTAGPLAWPRIGVYMVDWAGRFRVKVSPTMLRLRRSLGRWVGA